MSWQIVAQRPPPLLAGNAPRSLLAGAGCVRGFVCTLSFSGALTPLVLHVPHRLRYGSTIVLGIATTVLSLPLMLWMTVHLSSAWALLGT